ncbi:hypothetical protein TEA_012327 [Camellia sinensis var. sinensis]|uniref:BTB domain-containing protein n=1 Tax=Camellia sinensis var. sinensis TaxID=542762 RepID=A0A4S4D782_CAMSN|nr:hypothetical protein TEA_012327 [Camellia sinensis var. sinensis]
MFGMWEVLDLEGKERKKRRGKGRRGGAVGNDRRKRRTIGGGSLKGLGVAEAGGGGGQQWGCFDCVLSPDDAVFFLKKILPQNDVVLGHWRKGLQEKLAEDLDSSSTSQHYPNPDPISISLSPSLVDSPSNLKIRYSPITAPQVMHSSTTTAAYGADSFPSSFGNPGSQFNDPNSSDVKLTLSSKDGLTVSLNVHWQILIAHSRFFTVKLSDRWLKQQRTSNAYIVKIVDCDDVEVYIEALSLMYCKDLRKKLMKEDVTRVLGILKKDIDVKFPKSYGTSNLPLNYSEMEKRIKEMKWKKERILEDMQREQALFDHEKLIFDLKKHEYVKFLAESSSYATQNGNAEKPMDFCCLERMAVLVRHDGVKICQK